MKSFVKIAGNTLLAITILLVSFATSTDLTLLPDTLMQRESTYTSVTDYYEIDIFTKESEEKNAEYLAFENNSNNDVHGELFAYENDYAPKNPNQELLNFAVEQKLFSGQDSETYFKQQQNFLSILPIWTYILFFILLMLLVIIISKNWHAYLRKRKQTKKKGESNVY